MKLNAIRVVLIETSHPGNIGATARAMKTMGLSRLYLVNPKHFPDNKANEMASGAQDILEQAVCVNTLSQALSGTHLVFMTSARSRSLNLPMYSPESAAKHLVTMSHETEIAFVFGRERTGLTNDELLHGHYHVEIPANPAYPSLNLAQAVQIICYEIAKNINISPPLAIKNTEKLASADELEKYYTHLQLVLEKIDFLKPSNPRQLMLKLRRLFNRAKLEETEVHILRGILTQVTRHLNTPNGGG